MAITVPSILKEKKYSFIVALFLLLMFGTFVLISNTESPFPATLTLYKPDPFAVRVNNDPPVSNSSLNTSTQFPTNPEINPNPPVSNAPLNESVVIPVKAPVPTASLEPKNAPIPVPVPAASSDSVISSNTESATNNISSNIENNDTAGKSVEYNRTDVAAVVDDDDRVADVEWKVCDGSVAVDYIPCLDNMKAIKKYRSHRHMEHRERHCPDPAPRCLVPLPKGYKLPVQWPKSRDTIWYSNVPHPKLVEYKKDQRWVVKSGNYFIFPGGGTQFRNGANYYIDSIEKTLPAIEFGKKTRVVLDVGCGVASFGGAMLDRNVITMSFAPKDEHEAQIQFALERGIPATLAVIGTRRLTFPDNSFDLIHCARCRVHWQGDGGKPLIELNRLLRPGGYFLWSATPVYKKDERHKNIWRSMVALTESLCWKMVAKNFFKSSRVGLVIYQKPVSPSCYQSRRENNPPLCDQQSRPNNSWYEPLDTCIVPLPIDPEKWPSQWPERLSDKPLRLSVEQDAEEAFRADTKHWSALVSEVYIGSLGIDWSSVRNIMDMNAGYGGFAAALINQPVWVMNVVPIDGPDTLPIIFDRGLIGIYHDWCESFNTYPRTYDLLYASFLFGNLTMRCDLIEVAAEMDRVLRPGGYLLVQDNMEMLNNIKPILKSLHWSINVYQGQFLVGKKNFWRPDKKTKI